VHPEFWGNLLENGHLEHGVSWAYNIELDIWGVCFDDGMCNCVQWRSLILAVLKLRFLLLGLEFRNCIRIQNQFIIKVILPCKGHFHISDVS
jgi:hypothetical protein